MTPLQSFTIAGSDAGLQTNKKPFLLPDKAFPVLENAYVWRDRVVKRFGLELLGRLQRNFTGLPANFPVSPTPLYVGNLFTLGGVTDTDPSVVPGSVRFISGGYTWTDENQDGRLVVTDTSPIGYNEVINNITLGASTTVFIANSLSYNVGDVVYISGIATGSTTQLNGGYFIITFVDPGNTYIIINVDSTTYTPYVPASGGRVRMASSNLNYLNGTIIVLANAGFSGAAITISFSYNPNLPVMGIWQREIPALNDEQTIFFDTKYAYVFVGTAFQEYSAGTTWTGTDADFFWATNWRGSTPDSRLFFVTNFVNNTSNPIRYTSGGAWTNFAPIIADNPPSAAQSLLFQARILIPYYGRLLALNTWEGTTAASYAGATNFFARCRYSQIGSPIAADAWRSDLFGKGGFIDAPTSEQITSAIFFKNTLIVFFERTTWQLRYVGEYGIPFIWERISSDFGSESTFSTVLFDQGVAAVGDRAIISANAITADRIDLQIPDFVFEFRNTLNGPNRVIGVRDYLNELVYWCYNDFNSDSENQMFPNHVLVYNYRNNTYSIFRDNVTFFGTFQPATSITWDTEYIFWDDEGVTWDTPANQALFPAIVSGNQHGFVHYYNRNTPDEQSLYISAIDLTTTPIQLTILSHNLDNFDTIYVSGLAFVDGAFLPVTTNLNDTIYRVRYIDDDTIGLEKWITSITPHQYVNNFSFTPATSSTYVGNGVVALFPKLDVQTKDFNPYMQLGTQLKLSYVDFLMDATNNAAMTVNVYANTQVGDPSVRANILVGNQESETYLPQPYYGTTGSNIAWHRFYCTLAAKFVRLQFTYDDELMNLLTTHQQTWVLNAITLWTRNGGRNPF